MSGTTVKLRTTDEGEQVALIKVPLQTLAVLHALCDVAIGHLEREGNPKHSPNQAVLEEFVVGINFALITEGQ